MIKASVLDALVAAGATPEMIVAAIKADRADALANRKARNSRYYEANKTHSDVLRHPKTSEGNPAPSPSSPPPMITNNSTPTTPPTSSPQLSLASLARAPDDAGAAIVGLYEKLKAEKQAPKAKRSASVEFIQSVVGRWNKLASDWRLPQVMDITDTRQRAIIARSKDLTETYDFPDPIAGYDALFARVRASPFLRGEKGFRVDFDFLVRQSSFTKIMEGKYEADTVKRFS